MNNQVYDLKVIFNLINSTGNNCQNDLVKRFMAFYDLIDHFGLGMVILPSIVVNLGGTLSAKPCKNGHDGSSSQLSGL